MKALQLKSLLSLTVAIVLVACTPKDKDITPNEGSKFNVPSLVGTPYYRLFDNGVEIFGRYDYEDMHLFQAHTEEHHYFLNDEPRTYSMSSISLRITDSCSMQNTGVATDYQLSRVMSLNNGSDTIVNTYSCSVANITPIQLIRPEATTCDPIPLCYYDEMEIAWNADNNNSNGVVILAEWQGTSLRNPAQNVHIVSGEVVEDTGVRVLPASIFDGMPDEALVNLWLIRANVADFGEDDEHAIEAQLSELRANQRIDTNGLESIHQALESEQTPIAANGTVALLPIILIRNQ